MSGLLAADLLVGWIDDMAAHVSGHHRFDSIKPQENGFGAPEASASKSCGFQIHVLVLFRGSFAGCFLRFGSLLVFCLFILSLHSPSS